MKAMATYFLAGLAALLALKVLVSLLAPLVAFVIGLAGLALLLGMVVGVGWAVMRLLDGGRPQEG